MPGTRKTGNTVNTNDLAPGQFILFRAATAQSREAMTERYGPLNGFTSEEFVCLQELIGKLDGSGFTHVAIVSRVEQDTVFVVDQSMPETSERELSGLCRFYGGNPALVLEFKEAQKRPEAAAAALSCIVGPNVEPEPYSIRNMVLLSVLLRARATYAQTDPGIVKAIEAELGEQATEYEGGTCGAFAAEVLDKLGYPPQNARRAPIRAFQTAQQCEEPCDSAYVKLGAMISMKADEALPLARYVRTGENPIGFINSIVALLKGDDMITERARNRHLSEMRNSRAGIKALWSPADLLACDALQVVDDLDDWC